MRCRVCPRCGSGSFRKARAEAVIPIFKVRECRRCNQQYRFPTPWWWSLTMMLAGVGMMVPLALHFHRVKFHVALFNPPWMAILAGMGALIALRYLYKLLYHRGVTAPAEITAGDVPGAENGGGSSEAGRAAEQAANGSAAAKRIVGRPYAGLIGVPVVPAARPLPASLSPSSPSTTERKAAPPLAPSGQTTAALAAAAVAPRVAAVAPSAQPAAPAATARITEAAPAFSSPVARMLAPAAHVSPLHFPMPAAVVLAALRRGAVIPAHPLAINERRAFNERRMRGLTRYYLAAGAGGLAVGVHTTQFDIRKPKHNLLAPVLHCVMDEMSRHEQATGSPLIKVAGICGQTRQAVEEATLATQLGYDIGLLNLAELSESMTTFDLVAHCKHVANVIPLMGFLLHKAAGGRELSAEFWRAFMAIPNVVAIKIAAFNRYQTGELMRIVAESGRALPPGGAAPNAFHQPAAGPIAMYTGNDDHIVGDLLGEWTFPVNGVPVSQRIVGGLLGHWACWTRAAVEVFESLRRIHGTPTYPPEVALLNRQITDMNGAIFDAAHHFRGCLPGIHEVLRRQGLLEGTWCLEPGVVLGDGQADEIDRVIRTYPHLTDDDFVQAHRREWLD